MRDALLVALVSVIAAGVWFLVAVWYVGGFC